MTESEFERAVGLAKAFLNSHQISTNVQVIAAALLHARDAALEEAAKIADVEQKNCDELGYYQSGSFVSAAASAIRRLKSNQSKAPEGGGGR